MQIRPIHIKCTYSKEEADIFLLILCSIAFMWQKNPKPCHTVEGGGRMVMFIQL